MNEQKCPVCKSDSYLNPNIKMYVSPCFHKICESCLYKLFQHGHAPCPECGNMLRKINFISSTFEDLEVEREIKLRKLLNRHFLRSEDEFESEQMYNDYLEEYENTLFELMELRDENQCRDRINQIKLSKSILLPTESRKEKAQDDVVEVKRIKVEAQSWCKFDEKLDLEFMIENFEEKIPKEFVQEYLPGGLERSTILSFFSYSIRQLKEAI